MNDDSRDKRYTLLTLLTHPEQWAAGFRAYRMPVGHTTRCNVRNLLDDFVDPAGWLFVVVILLWAFTDNIVSDLGFYIITAVTYGILIAAVTARILDSRAYCPGGNHVGEGDDDDEDE